MDKTSASVVYANPFHAQNCSGDQQLEPQPHPHPYPHHHHHHQQQLFHSNYTVTSSSVSVSVSGVGSNLNAQQSPRAAYSDLYRFEDGGGDACGSLLVDADHFCDGEESQLAVSPSSSTEASASPDNSGDSLNLDPELVNDLQLNLAGVLEQEDLAERGHHLDDLTEEGAMEQNESYRSGSSPYMVFPRTAATFVPRISLPPHCPYLNVGQEQYIIQPDTIFVLGMRLNVTKNDIITYFGKLGVIKMDEATNKPKIFVYKNKMTGRSKGEATITYVDPFSAQAAINCLGGAKFMGQTLSVLPAYLSTRRGSVRYSYPRDLSTADQQRRQRAQKWKPAVDNWVCMLCRNSNFVWRSHCNRCQASKLIAVRNPAEGSPGATSVHRFQPHKDDWPCAFCLNLNFWYRVKCNRCHAPRDEEPPSSDSDQDPWELVVNPPCDD
ncbi:uncharacterized protein LOC108102083 [Drosophila ficusphila]|uniref:uncharacterized protein LOC108102083 n=1 Tax=Drosophila ficusphila TaxID=30025 RepID=UPI0007E898C7|nr:uncharacterized protein LOC108102083 [Drosophila ficusphila]